VISFITEAGIKLFPELYSNTSFPLSASLTQSETEACIMTESERNNLSDDSCENEQIVRQSDEITKNVLNISKQVCFV
jgi:hypothetical protein